MPYEWIAGRPYEGQLAEFGESLLVLTNRAGTRKKGDPMWLRGVFLGKTDNNQYITWRMDGIKTSRSAKRCTEHFDVKGISSVGIHIWEVKHATLATRNVPRKNLPKPAAQIPPVEDGPAQDRGVQDIAPAGTSGPVVSPRRGIFRKIYRTYKDHVLGKQSQKGTSAAETQSRTRT